MSADFDLQHFGDPSEPGAPGHQKWLRDLHVCTEPDCPAQAILGRHTEHPTVGTGKWSVKDTLSGAVYEQPNRLIAEKVAEMHGNSEVIAGWPVTEARNGWAARMMEFVAAEQKLQEIRDILDAHEGGTHLSASIRKALD